MVAKSKISSNPQTMGELLTQTGYKPHGLKKGEEITGVVASLSPRGIFLDIGAKAEGLVLEKEKKILDDLLSALKVGDKVRATVLNPESDDGYVVLSLRRQWKNKAWQNVLEAQKEDKIIEVTVTDLTRNGLLVDCLGIRGFVPLSQIVGTPQEKTIGQTLKMKVLEVIPLENRLIFSEKAVLVNAEDLKREFSKIKINQVYSGTITGTTTFGLFVSLKQGLEGLVHISEISWERVADLEKQFKVGDKVQVLVTGVDLKNQKLNLSIKQLTPDSWQELAAKFAPDQPVQGQVIRISKTGVSVTLKDGPEGFIHESKIPLGVTFKEGEKITCLVESVNVSKRRIQLVPVLKEKPVGYK